MMDSPPRPSQAPAIRTRKESGKSRDVAMKSSHHGQSDGFAKFGSNDHSSELRNVEKRETITVPARLVESVLGSCGSTLVQCCRESGASIALRPVLAEVGGFQQDVDDEFVAEVCGPPGAVSVACQILHDIIFEGGGEKDHPKAGMPGPCSATSPSDVSDVEEDFDIPRCYVPFVLGGRRSGEKGAGKNKGLCELEQKAGVQIDVMNADDDLRHASARSTVLCLRVRGNPERVAKATHELTERLVSRKALSEKFVSCPVAKMPLFCGKGGHAQEEIERKSGACVSIKMSSQYCYENEDGERMCTIEVVGTTEEMECASSLVEERLRILPAAHDSDKGKGKGTTQRSMKAFDDGPSQKRPRRR